MKLAAMKRAIQECEDYDVLCEVVQAADQRLSDVWQLNRERKAEEFWMWLRGLPARSCLRLGRQYHDVHYDGRHDPVTFDLPPGTRIKLAHVDPHIMRVRFKLEDGRHMSYQGTWGFVTLAGLELRLAQW